MKERERRARVGAENFKKVRRSDVQLLLLSLSNLNSLRWGLTTGSCELLSRRNRVTSTDLPKCSHAKWTIPPAVVLWLTFRRLRTARDVYKSCFLITVSSQFCSPLMPRRERSLIVKQLIPNLQIAVLVSSHL